MTKLIDRLRRINDGLAVVAGLALLACVAFTIIEIIMRQLGASLGGTDEISGYVMAIATSWGICYALTALAHVRIDLLRTRLVPAGRAVLDLIAMLSLTATALVIAYRTWPVLSKSLQTGARSNTPLETPLWLPQTLWWIGWVWFAVSALLLSAAVLMYLLQGQNKKIDAIAGVRSEG
ncbi:MAG: TRAP transporter small permease [Stappiaceae bacterium]